MALQQEHIKRRLFRINQILLISRILVKQFLFQFCSPSSDLEYGRQIRILIQFQHSLIPRSDLCIIDSGIEMEEDVFVPVEYQIRK